MDDERLTAYAHDETGWHRVDRVDGTAGDWVCAASGDGLVSLATSRGVSTQALRLLADHPLTLPAHDSSGRHLRARVSRSNDGELLLSLPTVSFVDATNDVHTGLLTCVVTDGQILTCELGDAHVQDRAAEKLCDGLPVPDEGVRQVLAALLLTLVNRASDVEAALGDAVAQLEELVVAPAARTGRPDGAHDPLGAVYALKREIAEARRALGPMSSALPELEAEDEAARDAHHSRGRRAGSGSEWLRHVRERSDRVGAHLDAHDDLLDTMLSVHLSNVSVRQNEDMRKISAWAAMITVPTLVAGIYGMNFRHMPELSWVLGYPLSLALMVGACLVLHRAFRRSGWL